MAKENEIQFAISLRNEASATLQQFKADAESAMKAAGASSDDYGKKTQSLTGWIKEQRTEQRQHNFLFQQGREIIGAGSIALALFGNTVGQSTAGMRQMTLGLNQGFVAFQGVNNVVGLLGGSIKALAGPWGLIISLAAGVGAAIFAMNKEVDNTKEKAEQAKQSLKNFADMMGKVVSEMKVYDDQTLDARRNLFQQEKDMIESRLSIYVKLDEARKKGTREVVISEEEALAAGVHVNELLRFSGQELADEIKRLRDRSLELSTTLSSLTNVIESTPLKNYPAVFTTLSAETQKASKSTKQLHDEVMKLKRAFVFEPPLVGLTAELNNSEIAGQAFIQSFGSGIGVLSLNAGNQMYAAFDKAFKGANSLLEQFAANVLASMAEIAAQQSAIGAISGILSLIPGLGTFATISKSLGFIFHDGGDVPKAHNGMFIDAPPTREFPILVRGGETVRTEEQEASLQKNSGITVIVNNYGPISTTQAFKEIVEKGMREIGVSDVAQYFKNSRSNLSIATT